VLLTVVLLVDPEGLAGIVATTVAWLRRTTSPAGGDRTVAVAVPEAPAVTPGGSLSGVLADSGATAARAADPRAATLLDVRGVYKEYGGLSVLHDVTLALPERGLFGLCGPNGAGKSTLLNVIGGSVPPSAGEVMLSGADITRRPPHERFQLGVSRTFQAVHLIKGRTVLDNVAVACLASHTASIVTRIGRSRLDAAREKAARTLADLGMAHLADREVSSLTLETQRMVELARALAPSPRLLLLDEPASGLSEEQRQRLAAVLTTLAGRTCVLLVEHDLALVAQVSERIFVLSGGRLVFEGGPADFRSSPVVNSLLVGS
jgi:branched-chain amino acid transport system ATP-binding protein